MQTPIRSLAAMFVALAAFATVATGCGLGSFTFTEESDEIEVEGKDALTKTLSGLFPNEIPMTVNLEQRLQEQDASGARAVYLVDLEFRMTDNTEEEDFGFLNTIEIDVDADDLDRELLAWHDDIPADEAFHLEVDNGLDLKPYAEAGMDLLTEVEGNQPDDDARFKVYATFEVEVL